MEAQLSLRVPVLPRAGQPKQDQVITSLTENTTVQILIVMYDTKNCTVYAHLPQIYSGEKYFKLLQTISSTGEKATQ